MAGRTVYLVRHGCTSLNQGVEKERGWTDVPLDAAGRKEAIKSAAKLSKLGIKALVSSDLRRAKQTAAIISDYLDVPPEFYSDLRTWDTGNLEGQPKAKAEPVIAYFAKHQPEDPLQGGESFNTFCGRVRQCFTDIFRSHTENPMAIVIHHRVERLIKAADASSWDQIDIDMFLAKGENPGNVEKWTPDLKDLSSGLQKSRRASGSVAANASTSPGVNVTILRSSYT